MELTESAEMLQTLPTARGLSFLLSTTLHHLLLFFILWCVK